MSGFEEFCRAVADEMANYDIKAPVAFKNNGEINRFNPYSGSHKGSKETSAWYTIRQFTDGEFLCTWGDWSNHDMPEQVQTHSKSGSQKVELTEKQKRDIRLRQKREAVKEQAKKKRAAQNVNLMKQVAMPISFHPYLDTKGFSRSNQASFGLLGHNKNLLIPVYDSKNPGQIINYQKIVPISNKQATESHFSNIKLPAKKNWVPDKDLSKYLAREDKKLRTPGYLKRFIYGAKKEFGYYIIGQKNGKIESDFYGLAEGLATGLSLYQIIGAPVIVVFDVYNLKNVVMQLKAKFPDKSFLNCADNDLKTELKNPNKRINPGIEAAFYLQSIYGIPYICPTWTNKEALEGNSDLNDYTCLHGLLGAQELVYKQIDKIEKSESFEYLMEPFPAPKPDNSKTEELKNVNDNKHPQKTTKPTIKRSSNSVRQLFGTSKKKISTENKEIDPNNDEDKVNKSPSGKEKDESKDNPLDSALESDSENSSMAFNFFSSR